jgi:hypothetical protein
MLFSRWFRRSSSPSPVFRPTIFLLEDRTVPSTFGRGFFQPSFQTSGPATHLEVIAPENVQSGQTFDVLVEAEDASNQRATGYTGTVHFTLGTADSGATLPVDYTFTARDHGAHLFQVTLTATGSQTITATDTTTSSITGSAATTVNPAPVATSIVVRVPETATAGVPTQVTVVAVDASGHRVPNYTGTVHFTSSDPNATLPADYTFTASDHGRHTFTVTFQTTNSQTVTATDSATSSITGQASTTVDTAGAVTHFGIFTLGRALAGFATPVLVVALDASNQVVPGYTGTVHFTSSDGQATLPADYTFTAADNGSHLFSVMFGTGGRQTLTATDTSTSSITGSVAERVITQLFQQNPIFDGWGGGWWGRRRVG